MDSLVDLNRYGIDNLPDDFETLRDEAKQYAEESRYAFIHSVIRLKKIKDNELFKNFGYKDITDFLRKDFPYVRSTAYNYLRALNYYDVEIFIQNPNIHYTKLLPSAPLLKSDLDSETKERIKEEVIEDINNGFTVEDMKERMFHLEIQYGLREDNSRPVSQPKSVSTVSLVEKRDSIVEEDVEEEETVKYVEDGDSDNEYRKEEKEEQEDYEEIDYSEPGVEPVEIKDDFKDEVELYQGQIIYKGQVIFEANPGLGEEKIDKVYRYIRNKLQKNDRRESQLEEDDEGIKKKINANLGRRNYDMVHSLVKRLHRLPLDKNTTEEELRKKDKIFQTKEEVKKYKKSPFWDAWYDRSNKVYRVRQKPRRNEFYNYKNAGLIADIILSGKAPIVRDVFDKADIVNQNPEIRNVIFNKYIKKLIDEDKRSSLAGIVRLLYDNNFTLSIEHSRNEYEPLLSWAIRNRLDELTHILLDLYDEGYLIDLQEPATTYDGIGGYQEYTPFSIAIQYGDIELVKEFSKRVDTVEDNELDILNAPFSIDDEDMKEKKSVITKYLGQEVRESSKGEKTSGTEALFKKAMAKRKKERLEKMLYA